MPADPWEVVAREPAVQPAGDDPWAVVSREPNTTFGKVKKFAGGVASKLALPDKVAPADDPWAVMDRSPATGQIIPEDTTIPLNPAEQQAASAREGQSWKDINDLHRAAAAGKLPETPEDLINPTGMKLDLRPQWEQGKPDPTLATQAARAAFFIPKNMIDEAFLGFPKQLDETLGVSHIQPENSTEKIAAGTGQLIGFVVGAPGEVTQLAMKGITKAFGEGLVITGRETAMERALKNSIKEAPALGAGFASASLSEATRQPDLDSALKVLFERFGEGAVMGGTFGTVRGVMPSETIAGTIKRTAVGMAALDLERGNHPFDDRDVQEKAFQYLMDAYFLRKGMGDDAYRILSKEVNDAAWRQRKQDQSWTQTEDRFSSTSSPSGEGGASQEAEPSPPPPGGGGAGEAWKVVRREPAGQTAPMAREVLRDANDEPYGFKDERGTFIEKHDADGKMIGYEKLPEEVQTSGKENRPEKVQGALPGGQQARLEAPAAEAGQATVEPEAPKVKPKRGASPFSDLIKTDPVYGVLEDVYYGGGFNMEALGRDYGTDTIKQLARRRIGLVTKAGKYTLDTVAQEYGFESGDVLMNAMLEAKPIKQRAKELKEEQEKAMGVDPALLKRGFTPVKEGIRADELYKGDKVIIDGEQFEVKDIDADENVTLKDGRTIKVGGYTKLDAEAMKRGKAGQAAGEGFGFGEEKPPEAKVEKTGNLKQGVMEGMSEAETFGLTPDEGEIGQSKAGQKAPPKQTNVFASEGEYANEPPITDPVTPEAKREEYAKRKRAIIELPEIVEFARKLMGGDLPRIVKEVLRGRSGAKGAFWEAGGKVKLKADLFKDLDTASKTLAHEIGHLVDWLPDKTLKRGNILGRVASLKKYMDKWLEEYPGSPDKPLTKEDIDRLKAETTQKVKAEKDVPDRVWIEKILKEVPKWEYTGLTPDKILDVWRNANEDIKASDPELYRFSQEADGTTKASIVRQAMKGIIDERLAQFGSRTQTGTEIREEEVTRVERGKQATQKDIQEAFTQALKDEVAKRKLYENKVMRDELLNVTRKWRPWEEGGNKKYDAYRRSSVELYADAFSALMNDPEMLRQEAPTFYKAFHNWIGEKAEVKAVYDEIQGRISSGDRGDVLEQRREFLRAGAEEGKAHRDRLKEEEDSRKKGSFGKAMRGFFRTLIDKNKKYSELEKQAQEQGGAVRDDKKLSWWVEELPYIVSEVGNYRLGIEKDLFDKAVKEGISLTDIHEYMLARRSATERKEMAGPGGIVGKYAEESLGYMKEKIGAEKFGKIEKLVDSFWRMRNRYVINVLEKANFLSPELMRYIKNNEEYATFKVLNDLEQRITTAYGAETTAHIYHQLGTLRQVDNVFVQTILKDMALIRAARIHQTKMALLEDLAHFGKEGEFEQATRRSDGSFREPRDASKGLVVVTPNGKAQGFYIDREFANAFKHKPEEMGALLEAARSVNSFFRQVFVNKNPGWVIVNPIRDALGTYKNLPKASMRKLAIAYGETFGDAIRAGFGKLPPLEREMLEKKMIVMDRNFRNQDVEAEYEQEKKLLSMGDSDTRYRNFVTKPIKATLDFLDKMGKAGERHGKMAGYRYLQKNEPFRGERETRHIVRTRIGTPDIYARGLAHNWTNNLFLFSNVNMQGYRASLESAKEAPGTYALKTMMVNVLPKVMFYAAAAGYLTSIIGEDTEKAAKKVGEYYRRMYNVIPLGLTEGGNAVVLTIPQDYTGQVIGAMVDAAMSGKFSGATGLGGLAAGQTPYNLHPLMSTMANLGAYYMFHANPVDYHYGNHVMSEDEFQAGGMPAAKAMGRDAWNNLGGSMIYRMRGNHVDEVEAGLKDTLGTFPVNALGRFLRVTNTGETEQAREVIEPLAQKKGAKHVEIRDKIIDSINESKGNWTVTGQKKLYTELRNDKLIDPRDTPFMEFRKKYLREAVKADPDTRLKTILTATDNEQKAALLTKYEKEMSPAEYKDFTLKLRKFDLISMGAFEKKAMQGRE